ncbi:hypothetical protein WBG78_02515 [Chryseolinea sp. T2]|uniref:hypothetical protein n=1 Tax=Chryseolinea sp. T2 TaxID=3129255 RepID=UPI003076CF29
MERISKLLFFLGAIIAPLVIQSCDDEEGLKPAPTVSLDAPGSSQTPGASVKITATVSAPAGGDLLTVYVGGAETETYDMAGAADFTQEFSYTVPETAVIGSTIVISFQALDAKGYSSAIANYTLTVGDPVVTLTGTLATRTLDAATVYLIKGQTFIPSGVVVTIPAGTLIKGDKTTKATLIVQPGGQLIANGTESNPIVFTSNLPVGSRDRGDWGGIILLGNGWVNQTALPAIEGITPSQTYGNITSPTTNADNNAGSLKYVRIEYAGIELTPNNETNSLTMGGVGTGTTIDHVQASFGGDDGFEWFGGTVNAKYLISLSTWDDDFDTDFGFGGNVQFGLAVRNTFFADQSGSNAFESDNQGNANDTPGGLAGYTRAVFSNITVLGPRDVTTGTGSGTAARAISANYQNALHLRRRSALSIFNSFFSGFPVGIRLDDQPTLDNLNNGDANYAYNVLASPNTSEVASSPSTSASNVAFSTGLNLGDAAVVKTYFDAHNNTLVKPTASAPWSPVAGTPAGSVEPYAELGINRAQFWGGNTSSNYPSNPDFAVTTGTLSSGANFTHAKLTGNSAIDGTVTFRGAFGTTDWTNGWAEFQPLNKAY